MEVQNQEITDQYTLYNGDSCEVIKGLPDNSVHLTVTSIPFSNLYIYSDSYRDIGNCADDEEFFTHFSFLIPELYRVTVPGRICAIHCKQLVNYKGRDGQAGLRDFRGDIIRAMQAHGWVYHSEICIWTDPVLEMQKTKAHGLLWKQLRKDSSFSRQGMPEYMLIFRKWAKGETEESLVEPVEHTKEEFPVQMWQQYASPVWFDIRRTDVLNVRIAREDQDEKHICPLQLEVIKRCIELWSNPGDVIFDPFAGIGSTPYEAIKAGRKGLGIELKEAYFYQAIKNCEIAVQKMEQGGLFE